MGGKAGTEIAPLGTDWLHDLVDFDAKSAEEWEELREGWRRTRSEENEF